MTARIFKTEKGTDLPLLNLKGKDYLEVKYRLVWFREDHPKWSIETSFVAITDRSACAKATIKDESGRIIATSHKTETSAHFPDFMEKAETGAIGRALALIGYGTQFCADELDEGGRIVDSPVPASKGTSHPVMPGMTRSVGALSSDTDLGEYQISFGKKYAGKRLKEVPQEEIESYVAWLETNAAKKNQEPTHAVVLLKNAVDRFFHPEKYRSTEASSGPSKEVHEAS